VFVGDDSSKVSVDLQIHLIRRKRSGKKEREGNAGMACLPFVNDK